MIYCFFNLCIVLDPFYGIYSMVICGPKQKKGHHNQIQHIRIRRGTRFYLKSTILNL